VSGIEYRILRRPLKANLIAENAETAEEKSKLKISASSAYSAVKSQPQNAATRSTLRCGREFLKTKKRHGCVKRKVVRNDQRSR
jgi:hypothetical protein